jgi:hypothetical protein
LLPEVGNDLGRFGAHVLAQMELRQGQPALSIARPASRSALAHAVPTRARRNARPSPDEDGGAAVLLRACTQTSRPLPRFLNGVQQPRAGRQFGHLGRLRQAWKRMHGLTRQQGGQRSSSSVF